MHLSVGIEHPDDLIADLSQALETVEAGGEPGEKATAGSNPRSARGRDAVAAREE